MRVEATSAIRVNESNYIACRLIELSNDAVVFLDSAKQPYRMPGVSIGTTNSILETVTLLSSK